jgi:cysteine-rich repeat protein
MMQNSFKFLLICACLSLASQLIGCDQNASSEPLDNIDSETKDTKVTTFADQNDTEESDVQTVEDVPEDLSDESSQTDLTSATDLGSEDIEDIHDVELTDAHLDDASDTTPADIPSDTSDRPDTTSTDIPYDVVGIDSKDPSSEDAEDSNPQDSIVAPDVIQVFSCGDGLVISPEVCDDGNAMDDGNGCSSTCQRNDVCGNALLETLYETCDDGNNNLSDDCPDGLGGTCQPAFCGDGFIWSGVEQCEQGAFAQSQCIDCEVICNDGFANCNQSFDDGCEIILASDPQSCGACGHNCYNEECVNGQCQSELIVWDSLEGTSFLGSFTVTDNAMIFIGDGSTFMNPTIGYFIWNFNKISSPICSRTQVSAIRDSDMKLLRTESSDVFWINNAQGQLKQDSLLNPGFPSVVLTGMGSVKDYVLDFNSIYWIDSLSNQINHFDRSASTIEVFAQGFNRVRHIAFDSQFLYAFDLAEGQTIANLWRISRDTGEMVLLTQTTSFGPMKVDRNEVFWLYQQPSPTFGKIESISSQGGAVTVHVASGVGLMDVDDQYLYWLSSSGIIKRARDGNSEHVVLPRTPILPNASCSSLSLIGAPNVWEMAVDDQFVYWVEGDGVRFNYAVMRVAK